MAEKNNATCSICGTQYHMCLSCKDSVQLQPWKIYCCSADCYKTFQVVRGFSTGVYTKEEFKSKLKNIDLSNLENYRDHIKSLIKETLREEPVVEIDDNVEESVETKVTVEELEKMVDEKPIVSRRRYYKAETE